MIGLHNYKRILAFTIKSGKRTHQIHEEICMKCGHIRKENEHANICGK